MLTERDSGTTVALAVGESLALRLSNDWLWSEPQAEGSAVSLIPVPYFADPGYTEWGVEAIRPGETVVRVAGTPQCPAGGDCGREAIDVVFRFEVQGTAGG